MILEDFKLFYIKIKKVKNPEIYRVLADFKLFYKILQGKKWEEELLLPPHWFGRYR